METSTKNPNVGLENMKVLREVKYHQMLYELLSKQYEVARLDESKDSSIVQILDKALEPEKKFKPKRSVIALISFLVGLFTAVAWAFSMEAVQGLRQQSANAEKLQTLREHLRLRRR